MTKNTLKISWLGRSPLIEENSSTFSVCLTSQKNSREISVREPLFLINLSISPFAKFAKEVAQISQKNSPRSSNVRTTFIPQA